MNPLGSRLGRLLIGGAALLLLAGAGYIALDGISSLNDLDQTLSALQAALVGTPESGEEEQPPPPSVESGAGVEALSTPEPESFEVLYPAPGDVLVISSQNPQIQVQLVFSATEEATSTPAPESTAAEPEEGEEEATSTPVPEGTAAEAEEGEEEAISTPAPESTAAEGEEGEEEAPSTPAPEGAAAGAEEGEEATSSPAPEGAAAEGQEGEEATSTPVSETVSVTVQLVVYAAEDGTPVPLGLVSESENPVKLTANEPENLTLTFDPTKEDFPASGTYKGYLLVMIDDENGRGKPLSRAVNLVISRPSVSIQHRQSEESDTLITLGGVRWWPLPRVRGIPVETTRWEDHQLHLWEGYMRKGVEYVLVPSELVDDSTGRAGRLVATPTVVTQTGSAPSIVGLKTEGVEHPGTYKGVLTIHSPDGNENKRINVTARVRDSLWWPFLVIVTSALGIGYLLRIGVGDSRKSVPFLTVRIEQARRRLGAVTECKPSSEHPHNKCRYIEDKLQLAETALTMSDPDQAAVYLKLAEDSLSQLEAASSRLARAKKELSDEQEELGREKTVEAKNWLERAERYFADGDFNKMREALDKMRKVLDCARDATVGGEKETYGELADVALAEAQRERVYGRIEEPQIGWDTKYFKPDRIRTEPGKPGEPGRLILYTDEKTTFSVQGAQSGQEWTWVISPKVPAKDGPPAEYPWEVEAKPWVEYPRTYRLTATPGPKSTPAEGKGGEEQPPPPSVKSGDVGKAVSTPKPESSAAKPAKEPIMLEFQVRYPYSIRLPDKAYVNDEIDLDVVPRHPKEQLPEKAELSWEVRKTRRGGLLYWVRNALSWRDFKPLDASLFCVMDALWWRDFKPLDAPSFTPRESGQYRVLALDSRADEPSDNPGDEPSDKPSPRLILIAGGTLRVLKDPVQVARLRLRRHACVASFLWAFVAGVAGLIYISARVPTFGSPEDYWVAAAWGLGLSTAAAPKEGAVDAIKKALGIKTEAEEPRVSAPTVEKITPPSDKGLDKADVAVTIDGKGFVEGAVVRLRKDKDVIGAKESTTKVTETRITCAFDLKDRPTGKYDVEVVNKPDEPDKTTGKKVEAFEVTPEPAVPAPTVQNIKPNEGKAAKGTVGVTIAGTGFAKDAQVKLRKECQDDIDGEIVVDVTPTKIDCKFDLTSKTPGKWNVVVINPDKTESKEPVDFEVK